LEALHAEPAEILDMLTLDRGQAFDFRELVRVEIAAAAQQAQIKVQLTLFHCRRLLYEL
jgi:hypothetical protein